MLSSSSALAPPWWAAVPRHSWPDGLAEEMQAAQARKRADGFPPEEMLWDSAHGDRRTELVCIGRALDHEAAQAQLDACLLTAEEMALNADRLALKAGFEQKTHQHGEHQHEHCQAEDTHGDGCQHEHEHGDSCQHEHGDVSCQHEHQHQHHQHDVYDHTSKFDAYNFDDPAATGC